MIFMLTLKELLTQKLLFSKMDYMIKMVNGWMDGNQEEKGHQDMII